VSEPFWLKENKMKLTDVIAVWDVLHVKDTGEIAYCDFESAIEKIVGIENDVCVTQPRTPNP